MGSSAKCVEQQVIWDECLWAQPFPDLHKACYLARISQFSKPRECKYFKVDGIIQEGPTCGLVATSILLNGCPNFKCLLLEAKNRGYSNNGEMCNANQLLELLESSLSSEVESSKVETYLFEGDLDSAEIRESLRNGSCLLVPYDADFNHAPCLKNGHKAHWALIIGYIVDSADVFHVIARHGKTLNLAVWRLDKLAASNSNLQEFAPPKSNPELNYKVPEGDLGGPEGLKNKTIVVRNIQFDRIFVDS